MAALTLSQIEAQVRALLSDAGAGSLEFTPEQMTRAIDFAQVQTAKQLGVTYYESPLEVIARKVAIPLDAISVIRVEVTEYLPRLYGPTWFSKFFGAAPGDQGGELDEYSDYAGDVVSVLVSANPEFGFGGISFRPRLAMSPSDGVFTVIVRAQEVAPTDPPEPGRSWTETLLSNGDNVSARLYLDEIVVSLPAPYHWVYSNTIVTVSVIRPWISSVESLEASFDVQFGNS